MGVAGMRHCSHSEHRIRVELTNSPAQRVKTLAHEIGHALIHAKCDNRELAELEAESTFFGEAQTALLSRFPTSIPSCTCGRSAWRGRRLGAAGNAVAAAPEQALACGFRWDSAWRTCHAPTSG